MYTEVGWGWGRSILELQHLDPPLSATTAHPAEEKVYFHPVIEKHSMTNANKLTEKVPTISTMKNPLEKHTQHFESEKKKRIINTRR